MNSSAMGLLALVGSVALLGIACEDKKSSAGATPPSQRDGGTDKYATADPKLEKALQTASSSSSAENAPPPDGVFAPGAADRRHPKGATTTVDLLSDGAEPRVSLATADASSDAARTASYGPAILEIGMQLGPRRATPRIDLELTLGPGKKDEGGADWLAVRVKRATPAKEQYGQLPPESDKEIAALEGTQFRIRLTPDGRESDLALQLGKTSSGGLETLMQAAAEALVMLTVPLPSKPVGAGAQWIAETRMPWTGADAIAYRAYRVKSIEGDRVELTLEAKAYAAGSDIPGIPKGTTLVQFAAEGQGDLELVRGELLARNSSTEQRAVMVLQAPGTTGSAPSGEPLAQAPGSPGGVMTAQLQSDATFVRGADLRLSATRGAPLPP